MYQKLKKLRNQSNLMNETKIFCIERIKFAAMMNGGCSDKHIGYARSVAECVGFTKARKILINWFTHRKQLELVNEFKVPGKTFFIPATQQKLVSGNGGDGQIAGSQVIAPANDLTIFTNDLNQNIGIQNYHECAGQAEERISVMEGKEGSKTISSQNILSFKSAGKERSVVFSSTTSFTTTSTCLPNKYSGNTMVWSFSVGMMIWRYIRMDMAISKIQK